VTILAISLLVLGLLSLWLARRMRRAAGLPTGRVVAQDTLGPRRAGESLYDPVLDLAGRPDYLIEQRERLIPIEIKSGRSHAGPRPSHRLQLAAYCRLVESVYARRPPYGILQYADQAYAIPYTRELEEELAQTLAGLRADLDRALDRSHESPERCRACGFRDHCDQALA
jgi:CRISPR/Cas system-associated exonuclease Cas4 (RecB family)